MNSTYSDGKFYAVNKRYNPFVAEMVADLSVGKVVDFGCGIGTNLYNLMMTGWDVYAVDIEPLAIEKAQDILPAKHVFLSDVDSFNFSMIPNVDLVLCNYVFQHLSYEKIERFIMNVSAKTNPNGHFILSFFEHRGNADFGQVSSCFENNGWKIVKKRIWRREDVDHGTPHIHEGIESFWRKMRS